MEMNTKQIGDISEMKILAKLLEMGYSVLTPIGDRERFDLVVYHNDKFIRVQCKTGKIINGAIDVTRRSSYLNSQGKSVNKYYTSDEIDYIMIYEPTMNQIYIVDVNNAPSKLRVVINKQIQKTMKFAVDYEFKGF